MSAAALVVAPPPRVVVVNSHVQERETICRLLGNRGYMVECYATAAEAIDALSRPPSSVLLVDAELSDMAGDDFLQAVEERGLHLPIIVTVPKMAVSRAVEAMRHGAIDIVERPLDERRLARAIDRVLSRPVATD